MGELLSAFAYASDLAFGLQLEDSMRSCYVALRLVEQMGLPDEIRRDAYYAALLKDAGCTSWTTELAGWWQTDEIAARRELLIFTDPRKVRQFQGWLRRFIAPDRTLPVKLVRYVRVLTTGRGFFAEAYATTANVACRISARLGMPEQVQNAMLNLFEHWNGEGAPAGLSGEDIPLVSRLVLPTYFLVPFHRTSGRQAALEVGRAFSGRAFDPAVIAAFEDLGKKESFWEELESPNIHELVLSLEPESDLTGVGEDAIDRVALAFADFIDLKSRRAAAHSRRVGAVAEQIARLMNCAEPAVVQIRRAALMHDLGLVAVPSYTIDRPWQDLGEAERDAYRLHPYHGERILKRVAALAPLAEMVGTHQERFDGSGYYRGLAGSNTSLGGRIIAVADRLDELTHEGTGQPALSVGQALDVMQAEPFDPEVLAALSRSIGGATPAGAESSPRPAGLTEREIEVLGLMAQGLTRREIGRRLGISEHTVRNHLDHIYDKTGATNRVLATMFAMENGILSQ